MKRIIFFSKNLNIGGMEKALVTLLNALASKYDITLVLEEKKGILLKEIDTRIRIEEYKLSESKNVILRKLINFSKRFIWNLKNHNKYDFACNYATYSVIGSRLAQSSSKNNALYVHSDYYNVYEKNETKIKDFFSQLRIDKFKRVVFVSNEALDNLIQVIPRIKDKSIVINNLFDVEKVLNLADKSENLAMFKTNNYNLLFVGRIDNNSKNFELLIESFALAHNKRSDIRLFIIGDGPYMNDLKLLIKKNDLENSITLLGEKINPYPYMKKCDALILTSKYEGFPVIYTEALLLNKKVLTTVAVSDDNIDVRDYFTILKLDKHYIADIITSENKESIKYQLNCDELNKTNLNKFIQLIERNEV